MTGDMAGKPALAIEDLPRLLAAVAEIEPDRVALTDGDTRIGYARLRGRGIRLADQIALVEHDEIGTGDLILKNLLDWIVVIEGLVSGALARERGEVVGNATLGERGAIDHRHHAINGDAALDRRPVERLHERLRQS